jgi:hypothetical protein
MEKGTVMISRIMHCENCDKHDRTLLGTKFIVIGATSGKYAIRTGERYGKRGLTPHLIQFIRNEKDGVLLQTVCTVNGCGVTIKTDTFIIEEKRALCLPFNDWESLQNRWTDCGYEI